jgi:hypothetical protein
MKATFMQFMQTRSPGTTSWGNSHNALSFGDPGSRRPAWILAAVGCALRRRAAPRR